MLKESDFPTVEEIARAISHLPGCVEPDPEDEEDAFIDVRLQVREDGTWTFHSGDSSYDQDHRGFWGSSSIAAADKEGDILETARNLREQAIEQCAMAGMLEEEAEQATYDLDTFFEAYLEAALRSTTDESTESGGEPLDANYSADDIPEGVRERLRAECADFVTVNAADLAGIDPSQAGHDFWLTRNGHGAGFWDRDLGEIGERLTYAASVYREIDLYVGDGGKIYASGYER